MGSNSRVVWSASEAVTYYNTSSRKSTTFSKLKPIPKTNPFSKSSPKVQIKNHKGAIWSQKHSKRSLVRVIIVKQKKTEDSNPMQVSRDTVDASIAEGLKLAQRQRTEQRLANKTSQRKTYLVAAIMSTLGVSSAAIFAVYYRFYCQMQGGEFPLVEMFGTFSLAVGSAVGMEFWARWAHKALWHASLWHMHVSHHRPRDGPFEVNDVFAIVNAVPAIALLSYGLFNHGLFPGLCFGAGLGITLFGMAYMFVHDGLVHRRFPVGPIANFPYLRKVAAAHQLHHSEKFQGVPYGLFLGPKEVEVVGGMEELEKEIQRRTKESKSS